MKPLDVPPAHDHEPTPGLPEPRTGKSGEGAASALEQLIRRERYRGLHQPVEPSNERASA